MRVKEGVLMNRKDYLNSLKIAGILFLLIVSNIGLIFMMLSQRVLFIGLYGLGVALIILTLTKVSMTRFGFSINQKVHWIKNHIILWIMLDFQTLIILARYIFPKERPNGLVPEIFFLIHLLIVIFVIQISHINWYKKHERLMLSFIHLTIYAMLSYNFVWFMIQTMQ